MSATISGSAVLNSSVEMEMANNEIDDLIQSWKDALHKAAGISGVAVLNHRGEMDTSNEINQFVKRWTEALREAASISGVVVQNFK